MLSRREFLATSIAAIAATRLSAGPANVDPSEVLLNRLTFGANARSRAQLAELGPQAWLDAQLAAPAFDEVFESQVASQTLRIWYDAGEEPNVGAWNALDEMRPLSLLHAEPETLLPRMDWEIAQAWEERARPATEVIAASLTRAVHAPGQLREVMTQFWHDHFNVHSDKSESTANFYPHYDRLMRANSLGNFRVMLQEMATAPAMLIYLNNDNSSASPANENFARELLELHTLGAAAYLNTEYSSWEDVPRDENGLAIGYIDEDVYEVARAFTGWTIGDGRYLAEGRQAPMTGTFYYEETWHDPYQKRILAQEMPPNRGPMADGNDVLDMLSTHPATARLISTKIARRLLTDVPSEELITAMMETFLAHSTSPDQIAQVIRTLVAHPDFEQPPSKIRRPFEFLAAMYRASGAKVTSPEAVFHDHLRRVGWEQHTFPPPTGHPDTLEKWRSGTLLLRYTDMAIYAHDEWFGVTSSRLNKLPDGIETYGAMMAHWSTQLHGTPDDMLPELLEAVGASPDDPLPFDSEERHDQSAMAIAFAALSPQFLTR